EIAEGIDRAATTPVVLVDPVVVIGASTVSEESYGTCNQGNGGGPKSRRNADGGIQQPVQDNGIIDAQPGEYVAADLGVNRLADHGIIDYAADAAPDMYIEPDLPIPDADLRLMCEYVEVCPDNAQGNETFPSCAYNMNTREYESGCCFDPELAVVNDLGSVNETPLNGVYCVSNNEITRPDAGR
ncbi:hypothetical protein CL620_00760, partial [archaeon]|nr:hypothetical protein [archaeon]